MDRCLKSNTTANFRSFLITTWKVVFPNENLFVPQAMVSVATNESINRYS